MDLLVDDEQQNQIQISFSESKIFWIKEEYLGSQWEYNDNFQLFEFRK